MDAVGLAEIFFIIVLSSLLSFGGGGGLIPVIQAQWVGPGLLSPGAFSIALAMSHLTPGPKAGFAAGVGFYLAGVPGAIVAVLGLALPTCLGAAGVTYAANRLRRAVLLLTPSSGYVIAALIAAAAWGIAEPMQFASAEILGAIVIAVLVAWRNISPVLLVVAAVVVGGLWSAVAGWLGS